MLFKLFQILIKLFLTIDVDPAHAPQGFDIETYIEPRNLKLME